MLEEVLRYINNRFDEDANGVPYGALEGHFVIDGATLEIEAAKEGQYFWIEGSVLNDGLHRYPDTEMVNEEFDGRVVLLVVPNAVQEIADEIDAWFKTNSSVINGPYQSESFGGYSYSLAGAAGGDVPTSAWQAKFGPRLRQFRKLSRDWV